MTLTAGSTTGSAAADAVAGVGLAVVTIGIALAALLVVGFLILVRRGRTSGRKRPADDLAVRANIALVRLDDDVAATADDLGFAVAQFGETPARRLAAALDSARSSLVTAFALKQKLDDAHADSATQQREWNARILMLCETASEQLAAERAVLDELRGLERSAAGDLDAVRESIRESRNRMPRARETVAAIAEQYSTRAVAPIARHPEDVERLLEDAERVADDSATRIDRAGVSSVASEVLSAARDARRATQLLDEVDRYGSALAASSARLMDLVTDARALATEAKRVRDSPPDPRIGAAIGAAVTSLERAIAAGTDPTRKADPDEAIAGIEASEDALDAALAGARNEEQRLSHARRALAGALLTARSQIETTRAYLGGGRGGAGAEARTRLAEAVRLLAIAEAEADPVVALDTARSSATYSRDADALARYDLLS